MQCSVTRKKSNVYSCLFRNFVDVLKSGVFSYWFWVAVSVLFVTGTQNINVYCFGYLLACFYFFWHGLDFTVKEKRTVLRV